MTKLLLAFPLFVASVTAAQPVSIGVTGGVPITDAFETAQGNNSAYVSNTHRYVVGPTVEFHLPARFSLEIDGLYRRLGFDYTATSPFARTSTTANSWEFPALIKFDILPGPIRPFIDAGANFRHITGAHQVQQVITAGSLGAVDVDNPPEFNKQNDIGFTFGGGVTFKAGWFRISPQLRYTHWGSDNFRDPIHSLLHTNRNQGDFLLSITF